MFLFYIISYDVWFYISHLFLHNIYVYKTIHKYHHQINYKTMTSLDAYVGHFMESPLQGLGMLFPLLFISFNMQFIYALILVNIRGMLRHDIRFVWLIGNHHILHHTYPQYNFGEYWLDKLGGTCYPNKNEYIAGICYI